MAKFGAMRPPRRTLAASSRRRAMPAAPDGMRWWRVALPFLAFFGTGYFSGFGTITAEIFPTRVRATAQGFTYNIGRGLSAAAPFTIGALAKSYGLAIAFTLTAAFFVFSGLMAFALPETRGKQLE